MTSPDPARTTSAARALALLALPLLLAPACRGEERPAPEPRPQIVDLGDPVPAGEPVPLGGSTGLLAAPVGELPEDWEFVERSGETLRLGDLRGRFVVVDFVFTSCPGPCPPMMGRMGELQERIRERDDVRLLSISVDPANDTVEALADYAETYGADPRLWLLARMPIQAVNALTREELRVGDGGTPLAHSTKFVLVDREGRGRGFYDPLVDTGWIEKVLRDIDVLAHEAE